MGEGVWWLSGDVLELTDVLAHKLNSDAERKKKKKKEKNSQI